MRFQLSTVSFPSSPSIPGKADLHRPVMPNTFSLRIGLPLENPQLKPKSARYSVFSSVTRLLLENPQLKRHEFSDRKHSRCIENRNQIRRFVSSVIFQRLHPRPSLSSVIAARSIAIARSFARRKAETNNGTRIGIIAFAL